MIGCIARYCKEEAIAGDWCIKHYKADYDIRREKREQNMGKKESNPGPPIGAVKPPPPPAPPEISQKEPVPPKPSEEAVSRTKVCKRCNKDKPADKKFSKKRQLCNSCQVMISYYGKKGKPVPEYTGNLGGKKAVISVEVDNPLGVVVLNKPTAKKVQNAVDDIYDKSGKTIKKTEIIEHNEGRSLFVKATIDPTYYLSVDFSDYPELKARLDDAAHTDFRTPEMQVLAILDELFGHPEEAST